MTPVKKADVSAIMIVKAIIDCEGPSDNEFVRRKTHMKAGRTTKHKNRA